MNYRQKKADAYLDAIQGGVAHQGLNALSRATGLNRYVGDNIGGTVNSAGSLLGLFQGEAPTLEELDEMENDNYGWIPGNAMRRTMLRRRMVNKLLGGKPSTIYSEKWGPSTAGAVSMLGGGALGALTAGGIAAALGKGVVAAPIAVLGGMGGMSLGAIGALIANNIGAARAAMTPNRTDEEQQEYEQAKSQWKNWLIPGYARYNWYKSLGVSNRKLKEYQDKKKKDKDDMKKESSYEKIAYGITDRMIKRALDKLGSTSIGETNYFGSNNYGLGSGNMLGSSLNMLGSSFTAGIPSLTTSGNWAPNNVVSQPSINIYPGAVTKPATPRPQKRPTTPQVRPGSVLRTNPSTGEQYYVKQLPDGRHMVVSPSGHGVDYQTAQNNNARYGTYFPQQNPAQAAVGSATSNVVDYDPNAGYNNFFQNVKGRGGAPDWAINQAIAQGGPLGMRETARQRMDNAQATPGGVPAVAGAGNTDNTPRSLPSYSTASTFDKTWITQPIAAPQQPTQPTDLGNYGKITDKQRRDYYTDYEGSTEDLNNLSAQERSKIFRRNANKRLEDKKNSMTYAGSYNAEGKPVDQQSFDDATAKRDDTYKAVESTIRTPTMVAKWKEKGFTDEQIDAWVKRQTTKQMEKDYGKRPAMRPVMTPGVTTSSEDTSNGGGNTSQMDYTFSNPNARQTRFGNATDDFYDPLKVPTEDTVPRVDRIPSIESVTRPVSFGKAFDPHVVELEPIQKEGSANIMSLLFNEKSSSIAKRLLNGNDSKSR